MKKGIIAVLVVLTLFAISWAQQEFFFSKWEIKTAGFTPKGLIQAVLKNPEPKGIPSVVVQVNPATDTVTAYWYFDQGFPKLFVLEGGRYVEKPDQTKGCINCHKIT